MHENQGGNKTKHSMTSGPKPRCHVLRNDANPGKMVQINAQSKQLMRERYSIESHHAVQRNLGMKAWLTFSRNVCKTWPQL